MAETKRKAPGTAAAKKKSSRGGIRKKKKYTGNRSNWKAQREKKLRRIYALTGVGILLVILAAGILIFLKVKPRQEGKLTQSVIDYQSQVEAYCEQYNISEFSGIMLAMMQQESGGRGTDVMQCSESPFNKKYSTEPGSIDDPDYSIQVGVETFAYCLEEAGCTSLSDMDSLKLALQEYNFGNDYAGWALANYGGYSAENALEFSEKMKKQLGWTTYGDPLYVEHVLRYYEQK